MLIKITLILLVISIALYIITRVYFNTLSASNKLSDSVGEGGNHQQCHVVYHHREIKCRILVVSVE